MALGKDPSEDSSIALGTKILDDTANGDNEPEWVDELRSSFLEDGYSLSFDAGKWSIGPVGAEEIPLPPQYSTWRQPSAPADSPCRRTTTGRHSPAFKRQDWGSYELGHSLNGGGLLCG